MGNRLTLNCTNCGEAIAADDSFCGECGQKVEPPAPNNTPPNASDDHAHASKSEPQVANTGSSRNLIIGATVLVVIGIGFLITNIVQNDKAQAPPPTAITKTIPSPNNPSKQPQTIPRAPSGPSETLQGVIGFVQDADPKAQLCRQNSECLPAEGTEIETGDSLDSNSDVAIVFSIEGENDTNATHSLIGRITKFSLTRTRKGNLNVRFNLPTGELTGNVSNGLLHTVRIRGGHCTLNNGKYRASALSSGATFQIDAGFAYCVTRRNEKPIRMDASNPVIRW